MLAHKMKGIIGQMSGGGSLSLELRPAALGAKSLYCDLTLHSGSLLLVLVPLLDVLVQSVNSVLLRRPAEDASDHNHNQGTLAMMWDATP